jgi:hypothetical protein
MDRRPPKRLMIIDSTKKSKRKAAIIRVYSRYKICIRFRNECKLPFSFIISASRLLLTIQDQKIQIFHDRLEELRNSNALGIQ